MIKYFNEIKLFPYEKSLYFIHVCTYDPVLAAARYGYHWCNSFSRLITLFYLVQKLYNSFYKYQMTCRVHKRFRISYLQCYFLSSTMTAAVECQVSKLICSFHTGVYEFFLTDVLPCKNTKNNVLQRLGSIREQTTLKLFLYLL